MYSNFAQNAVAITGRKEIHVKNIIKHMGCAISPWYALPGVEIIIVQATKNIGAKKTSRLNEKDVQATRKTTTIQNMADQIV